ncbi:transmembrane 4 L6 family member 5-like isoform X2 [Hippoglossus stenolepis]|uniref:transmembrane 4 L6 family member 5-like isoform X2 n=1 Tax=Hippoglossus stenolepis TaxID=195615 RepID=UPI001FAFD8FE|nr:transmembrane 4 L6 family member 5-like isoform X2 [Hippoglossus stenolepis]
MCSGGVAKCARCIAGTLYPLVLISIICNIVLFFPGWDVKYARDGHLTPEVKYLGGLLGGGLMVLISAVYTQVAGDQRCCTGRCVMLLSIFFAAVGVFGALYSFSVAAIGLRDGPFCKVGDDWTIPFKTSTPSYLTNSSSWTECTEPPNVVRFNIGLFLTLMAVSSLQVMLCAIQIINGLIGCICGPSDIKEPV